jgi:hypothetical protein
MTAVTASKQAFFDAIVNERALEFCGEMQRKSDLIRWNLLTSKLEENKIELEKLESRTTPYDNVNTTVYYKTDADGESLILYGLNRGETGTPADAATYSSKTWKMNGDADLRSYWNRIFVRDPSTQPYWPIWQYFIDNSNGQLVNDPIFN